jgi:hypothetical protein
MTVGAQVETPAPTISDGAAFEFTIAPLVPLM